MANNGTWGDIPPPTEEKMTAVKALCLCLMAISHVREDPTSKKVETWHEAEKVVRVLLKQARLKQGE